MNALKTLLSRGRKATVAIVLFDDYELLEAWGPAELIVCANPVANRPFKLVTIGKERCASALGPSALPDHHPSAAPSAPEIIVVPGGAGWRAAIEDVELMRWLQAAAGSTKLILSVGSGAAILAAAGLLSGKPATTSAKFFDAVVDSHPSAADWQRKGRWVVSEDEPGRAIVTASGGAAGTDAMCFALSHILSPALASKTAFLAEYTPETQADEDALSTGVQDTQTPVTVTPIKVALVLYDQFELFDAFGPLQMMCEANRAAGATIYSVTTVCDRAAVECAGGPRFEPDLGSLPTPAQGFDLLLLPGGIGTLRELHNKRFLDWLRSACLHMPRVMSVCSGSALLARAGLLDGLPATTNKFSLPLLISYGSAKVKWQRAARFVKAAPPAGGGPAMNTSSGVSAGTDLMLSLIEDDVGADVADAAARRAEYVRRRGAEDDPFAVGAAGVKDGIEVWVVRGVLKLLFGGAFALGLGHRVSARMLL